MAYLSHVTHDKLIGKYTAVHGLGGAHQSIALTEARAFTPEEIGVVACGSFNAALRCAAPFGTAASIRSSVVWTGDADGDITIRAAWSGERLSSVERKPSVFVTCLKHHGGVMYAGMSDGFIRAFECTAEGDDYTLVSEARKHTGDVLCIESVGSNVFTGARDWQVFVWRWDGRLLRAVDQFSGHLLAVRSLTYARGLLYSSGDEGIIRCLNVSSGEEVKTSQQRDAAPGFPIHASRKGVKAIAAFNGVLFSGDEEAIHVWDAATGNHIKLLLKTEGAVLTLMADPSGKRIWSGGVDGVIRLWDARSPFPLLCSLNEHNGSFIRSLVPLSTLAATKAWSVDKAGKLKLWYVESDCSEFEDAVSTEEARLTETIVDLRESIVSNYTKLEQHKVELKKVEGSAAVRKAQLAAVFGRANSIGLKKKYYGRLLSLLQRTKQQKRCAAICASLALSSNNGLRAAYYGKLKHFAKNGRDRRKKEMYAAKLRQTVEQTMSVAYWKKLKEHARSVALKKRNADLASVLQRCNTGGMARNSLHNWVRWTNKKRAAKKRRTVSHALFRHTKNGLLFIYYAKLVAYFQKERATAKKGTLNAMLMRTMWRSMRHAYYMKWMRWYRRRSDAGRKKRVVQILMRTTAQGIVRMYWTKWLEWRMEGMHRQLESKHEQMQSQVKRLEMKLKAAKYITEEDLKHQVAKMDAEAAAVQEEVDMLEKRAAELAAASQKLDMEVTGFSAWDADLPIQQQVIGVCSYLKARGCSCRHDIKSILDANGKQANKGVTTFTDGMRRTRKAMASAGGNQSSLNWNVPTYGVPQMDPKYLKEAHRGVKDIILGVDQMRHFDAEFPEKLCDEIMTNINALYEVVTRVYAERKEVDDREWQDVQKKRESDPYAAQHGRLINPDKHSDFFLERNPGGKPAKPDRRAAKPSPQKKASALKEGAPPRRDSGVSAANPERDASDPFSLDRPSQGRSSKGDKRTHKPSPHKQLSSQKVASLASSSPDKVSDLGSLERPSQGQSSKGDKRTHKPSPHKKLSSQKVRSPATSPDKVSDPTSFDRPSQGRSSKGDKRTYQPSPQKKLTTQRDVSPGRRDSAAASKKANPGFKVSDSLAITAVTSASARSAGLKPGDVITAVKSVIVTDKLSYIAQIKLAAPGDSVDLAVSTDTEAPRTVSLVMGEM